MHIRKSKERDRSKVMSIARKFSSVINLADKKERLADALGSNKVLVACDTGDKPVGFVYSYLKGAGHHLYKPGHKELFVSAICVNANNQRNGAGKALLGELLKSNAHRTVTCSVQAGNDAGLALLKGAGFEEGISTFYMKHSAIEKERDILTTATHHLRPFEIKSDISDVEDFSQYTLEQLIQMLTEIDPNGIYTDEATKVEGIPELTKEEAVEIITRLHRGSKRAGLSTPFDEAASDETGDIQYRVQKFISAREQWTVIEEETWDKAVADERYNQYIKEVEEDASFYGGVRIVETIPKWDHEVLKTWRPENQAPGVVAEPAVASKKRASKKIAGKTYAVDVRIDSSAGDWDRMETSKDMAVIEKSYNDAVQNLGDDTGWYQVRVIQTDCESSVLALTDVKQGEIRPFAIAAGIITAAMSLTGNDLISDLITQCAPMGSTDFGESDKAMIVYVLQISSKYGDWKTVDQSVDRDIIQGTFDRHKALISKEVRENSPMWNGVRIVEMEIKLNSDIVAEYTTDTVEKDLDLNTGASKRLSNKIKDLKRAMLPMMPLDEYDSDDEFEGLEGYNAEKDNEDPRTADASRLAKKIKAMDDSPKITVYYNADVPNPKYSVVIDDDVYFMTDDGGNQYGGDKSRWPESTFGTLITDIPKNIQKRIDWHLGKDASRLAKKIKATEDLALDNTVQNLEISNQVNTAPVKQIGIDRIDGTQDKIKVHEIPQNINDVSDLQSDVSDFSLVGDDGSQMAPQNAADLAEQGAERWPNRPLINPDDTGEHNSAEKPDPTDGSRPLNQPQPTPDTSGATHGTKKRLAKNIAQVGDDLHNDIISDYKKLVKDYYDIVLKDFQDTCSSDVTVISNLDIIPTQKPAPPGLTTNFLIKLRHSEYGGSFIPTFSLWLYDSGRITFNAFIPDYTFMPKPASGFLPTLDELLNWSQDGINTFKEHTMCFNSKTAAMPPAKIFDAGGGDGDDEKYTDNGLGASKDMFVSPTFEHVPDKKGRGDDARSRRDRRRREDKASKASKRMIDGDKLLHHNPKLGRKIITTKLVREEINTESLAAHKKVNAVGSMAFNKEAVLGKTVKVVADISRDITEAPIAREVKVSAKL